MNDVEMLERIRILMGYGLPLGISRRLSIQTEQMSLQALHEFAAQKGAEWVKASMSRKGDGSD
jgi:hypothetical protein